MLDNTAALLEVVQGGAEQEQHLTDHAASVAEASIMEAPKVREDSAQPKAKKPPMAMSHTTEDYEACGLPPTKARQDTGTRLIYTWEDEQGVPHISDRPPMNLIASVRDISGTAKDFSYRIVSEDVRLPADFEGQLYAGSKRMYDAWHFFLGENELRQSLITLRLIGGSQKFDAHVASSPPNRQQIDGYYSIRSNQAVVKYDPHSMRRSLAISFHEVSHLITASHIGPTELWLTEGLAEYFESMQVKGQSATFPINQQHVQRLRKSPTLSLIEFLQRGQFDFYGESRSVNYAIAWSLVHYLMQGSPGMYALQEVVQEAREKFCESFSPWQALVRAYPGGMRRLEKDWRRWLNEI